MAARFTEIDGAEGSKVSLAQTCVNKAMIGWGRQVYVCRQVENLKQEHVQCTDEAEQLTWHQVIDVCSECTLEVCHVTDNMRKHGCLCVASCVASCCCTLFSTLS